MQREGMGEEGELRDRETGKMGNRKPGNRENGKMGNRETGRGTIDRTSPGGWVGVVVRGWAWESEGGRGGGIGRRGAIRRRGGDCVGIGAGRGQGVANGVKTEIGYRGSSRRRRGMGHGAWGMGHGA
jgi:hypothetical protein